jgi:hypothetical protein
VLHRFTIVAVVRTPGVMAGAGAARRPLTSEPPLRRDQVSRVRVQADVARPCQWPRPVGHLHEELDVSCPDRDRLSHRIPLVLRSGQRMSAGHTGRFRPSDRLGL